MKIYIVDKDFQTLKSYEEIIKRCSESHEASYYTSSSDLMKSIEAGLPEMVIIDADMNRGTLIADKIRKTYDKIRVIISSNNQSHSLEALQNGYNGYLLKPLKENEVLKILHSSAN